MTRAIRWAGALVALILIVVAGSCDKVWGISSRTLDPNLVCDESGCQCTSGFADCDGDQSNGCEANLQKAAETCGTCGTRCDNGNCNVGLCECKDGFADCDGDLGNGCEASIGDDPASCGACGHACPDSTCDDGRCAATVLAQITSIQSLALGGGYLYVSSCGTPSIQRIPVDGGASEPVFSGTGCVEALALDQGILYFTNNDQILALKLDATSAPKLITSTVKFFDALGVGGGYIYWNESGDPVQADLQRFSLDKGMTEDLLDDGFSFHALSVTPEGVYWAGVESVEYLPNDAIGPIAIAPVTADILNKTGIPSFTIDAHHAYWAEPVNGVIKTVPLGGGPESVLTNAGRPTSLLVDATSLYWTDFASGDVRMIALGAPNGKVQKLAVNQNIVSSSRMVGDKNSVYWFTGSTLSVNGVVDGRVWRATK